jgi:hypothetical protein
MSVAPWRSRSRTTCSALVPLTTLTVRKLTLKERLASLVVAPARGAGTGVDAARVRLRPDRTIALPRGATPRLFSKRWRVESLIVNRSRIAAVDVVGLLYSRTTWSYSLAVNFGRRPRRRVIVSPATAPSAWTGKSALSTLCMVQPYNTGVVVLCSQSDPVTIPLVSARDSLLCLSVCSLSVSLHWLASFWWLACSPSHARRAVADWSEGHAPAHDR